MRSYMLIFVLMALLGQLSSVSASSNSEDADEKGTSPIKVVAAAAVGSVIAAKAGTLAGFTSAGIAGSSIAATFQSTFGTPVIFSALQSIGATGGMAVLGPVGVAGAAVAGIGYYMFG